jgi:excisionase family DNA binding protein
VPMGMLTSRDLQDMLQVDRSTIYRMAEAGTIPAVKVGRQWRFPGAAIERWLVTPDEVTDKAVEASALAPVSCVQPITEVLADILGVMLVVTDMEGVPVTEVANPCGLFDTIARLPGGTAECIAGWQELAGSSNLGPRFTPSHLGLMCARAFIRAGAGLTAMMIAGGVAPDVWPPDDDEIRSMASSLGADPGELAAHIHEVYHLDQEARQRVIDTLPRVASMISDITAEYRSLRERLQAIAALTEQGVQT